MEKKYWNSSYLNKILFSSILLLSARIIINFDDTNLILNFISSNKHLQIMPYTKTNLFKADKKTLPNNGRAV